MSIHLLSLLKSASSERHAKAVSGLADGSISVLINHQSDYTLRATVRSGEHTYGCHLGGGFGSSCDCADFAWRGSVPCKHAIAVAVFALQPPQEVKVTSLPLRTPVTDKIHLIWPDDSVLCGALWTSTIRTWKRWTDNALNWSDLVCQDCLRTYTQPVVLKEAA